MTQFASKRIVHRLALMLALATTPLAAGAASAADIDVGSLHIAQPWARATPKSAASAAGYLTITNNGTAPDRLTCAAPDVAAQCEIHTMTTDNGVMKMRPVDGGLEIKPGETVTLKPGGLHVMFVDIKHPFELGHPIVATLQLEKAGTAKVEFDIIALGATAPGASSSSGSMMMESHGATSGGGMMMQMNKH